MIVYAVVDLGLSRDSLGDAEDLFIRREDAEQSRMAMAMTFLR